MREEQIISWIFLAISLASINSPSDIKEISMVADGINHAVPTHKEIQSSLSWLLNHGLINQTGSKYELTENGELEYVKASTNTKILFKIWENLESYIKNIA